MSELSVQAILGLFVIGYVCIAFEHKLGINKAATAVGMAALLWALLLFGSDDHHHTLDVLTEHLAETSQIIFFLLGAMTLVEVIDAHGAFRVVTDQISVKSRRGLLLVVGVLTFFMSSVLDNLTTTIVMVSLLRRMISDVEERMLFCSLVVIAANAGGAWTPIGDVTTTMLWIGGQITSIGIMKSLFIPSFACLLGSMAIVALPLKGARGPDPHDGHPSAALRRGARRVLALGLLAFIMVPVLKSVLHLPPFLGICVGLSLMWVLTDLLHRDDEEAHHVRVPHALSRVDVSSAFFFLGILLAVGALQTAGQLTIMAHGLASLTTSAPVVTGLLGVASAIIDNVPLVAAIMRMYPLTQYAVDDPFWSLVAYCAGTGGSLLIIGSAAGVALMGMEQITFGWYLRRAAPAAAVGYVLGLAVAVVLV
ncbi:MAG TPA: sodium:proton antiporter NhaD [Polyangiales bacterium]|nr:sodium:proton antiporter NhaD [Polyangiales bacterium]